MTAKTDEPTGVNWNGATTNERERVGIIAAYYREVWIGHIEENEKTL